MGEDSDSQSALTRREASLRLARTDLSLVRERCQTLVPVALSRSL